MITVTITPVRQPMSPPIRQGRIPAMRLDSLTNGELAVAVHAAGIPTNPDALSADQIKALAVAGIARLGLTGIYRLDAQSRAANVAYCDKTRYDASADVSAEVAVSLRIWGSWKQEQTATNLAYRLLSAIRRGEVSA